MAKPTFFSRLPVVHQLRQSVGLQRGMLVAGLVLTAVFLILAIFAPWIAPYSFNQLRGPDGNFGAQQPPSPEHLLGTTVGGYDVLSRTIWGAQTSLMVIVVAILLSVFIGIFIGLVILQVPLALPLAVVVFVTAFIPIVGATLAGILAALVALVANGPGAALAVLGVVVLVNQLEGTFNDVSLNGLILISTVRL